MDPNWFYSSLAQSAAAVVGLLGAILGSRLLQLLEFTRQSKDALLTEFEEMRNQMTSSLSTLNIRRDIDRQASLAIRNHLATNPGGPILVVDYTGPYSGTDYAVQHRNRRPDKQTAESLETEVSDLEKIISAYQSILSATEITRETISSWKSQFEQLVHALNPENFSAIQEQNSSLQGLAKRYADHRSSMIPRSSIIVIGVLAWLIAFSLVLPLGFLNSGSDETPKYVLLVLFAIGLIGMLAYFVVLIRSIWRAGILQLPALEKNKGE